jgi:glycosyltransferase involved in cell wall biosynthesis
MRVTLVIDSLGPGGAQRVLTTMANYWVSRGWTITLVTLEGPERPPAFALDPAVRVVPLGTIRPDLPPVRRVFGMPAHLTRLRSAIRHGGPDVVISFIDKVNVLTLLATLGLPVPVIVSERVDPALYSIGPVWTRLRRWTYPRAARVVVQSEGAAHSLARGVRCAEVVIPNPLAPPPPKAAGFSRNAAPTVIGMGRLARQKGFDILLRAFGLLGHGFDDWRLEVWGEGPERPALEALRQALGLGARVRLPGVTAAPCDVMRAADLFVLSSRFEGFPNVLCEAMACGLPAISFDCPSGPHDIVRHGVDGLLVPPDGEAAALTEALGRLMGSQAERERLAARAPEVLDRFGLDRVMGRWQAVLSEIGGPGARDGRAADARALETRDLG